MGIPVVAVLQIGQHLFQRGGLSLGDQFVIPALRPDGGVGRHENLEFGIGENSGADIPAVHDDAAAFREGMQALVHPIAHPGNGAHRAHVLGHVPAADFGLDATLSQIEPGVPFLLAEMKLQRADDLPEPFFVYFSVADDAGLHPGQGDATVHGAAVQIEEGEFLGD